jgi:hypothetical protein
MSQEPLYAIGAFRAVGGLSAWLTPNLLARVYGGDEPDRDALLWSRLAGSRELALAIGPVLSEGGERRRWLMLGLACDFADMIATLIGNRRNHRLSAHSASLALATYSVSALLTMRAIKAAGSAYGAHLPALEAAGLRE